MKRLHEWVKATVVVGPADEPMLRRAGLLEELAEWVGCLDKEQSAVQLGKRGSERVTEILNELAKEE